MRAESFSIDRVALTRAGDRGHFSNNGPALAQLT